MANYIIRQNTMNDKQYIQFEAVASGRYISPLNSKVYEKGKPAYFKAMHFSDGQVWLWVDTGIHLAKDRRFSNSWQLLKRIPADKNLSFDEIYALAVQYV